MITAAEFRKRIGQIKGALPDAALPFASNLSEQYHGSGHHVRDDGQHGRHRQHCNNLTFGEWDNHRFGSSNKTRLVENHSSLSKSGSIFASVTVNGAIDTDRRKPVRRWVRVLAVARQEALLGLQRVKTRASLRGLVAIHPGVFRLCETARADMNGLLVKACQSAGRRFDLAVAGEALGHLAFPSFDERRLAWVCVGVNRIGMNISHLLCSCGKDHCDAANHADGVSPERYARDSGCESKEIYEVAERIAAYVNDLARLQEDEAYRQTSKRPYGCPWFDKDARTANPPRTPSTPSSTSTDEEALALVMNVLQRIADTALAGFKGDAFDECTALSDINNLSRNTIDALSGRRLS